MPGPHAKHPSRSSRGARAGFKSLPSGGRKGKVPDWPLPADASLSRRRDALQDKIAQLQARMADSSDRRERGGLSRQIRNAEVECSMLSMQIEEQKTLEADLWATLWATPQAELWEDSSAFERELAQFVRWNVKGEQGDLDAAKEARIRGKEFGLTPLTLMGLRAEIERAGEAEARGNRRRAQSKPAAKGKEDPRGGLYAVN